MKFMVVFITFFPTFFGYGQGITLMLIDSYSYQQIKIDSSFRLNKKHTVDPGSNLIFIPKSGSKKLRITSRSYNDFEEKLSRKDRNDTIVCQLKPGDSLARQHFHEIWEISVRPTDTLHFTSATSLQQRVLSHLNCLSDNIGYACDNGMCNYANTYVYRIRFAAEDSVFRITQVTKTQPIDYECEILENYLNKLSEIFPYCMIGGTATGYDLRFIIHR